MSKPQRAPSPRVSSPILFRAERGGPEFQVNPCSGRCREWWLAGYIVLSCKKCTKTLTKIGGYDGR